MSTITAPEEQSVLDNVPKQLYIGGEWRDGAKGTLSVEDPATGESLCDVADASTDDANAALDAAVAAGPDFAATAPRDRGEILRRAFDAIMEREEELALLMTLEMGKPLKESKAEIVAYVIATKYRHAGEVERRNILARLDITLRMLQSGEQHDRVHAVVERLRTQES